MCQLGVDQVFPSAPTREQAQQALCQPNNHDTESGTTTTKDNHVLSDNLHSLDTPRAGLVHNPCQLDASENSHPMATSSEPSQRPKFQYSQSFRQQSTQDALADVAPSARPSDVYPSVGADTSTSNLDGTDNHFHGNGIASLSEENLQHRLNASGSVQAIVVDDDVLFAGLQGGDIVVSMTLYIHDFSAPLTIIGLVVRDL